MIPILRSTDDEGLKRLVRSRGVELEEAESTVRRILKDVRRHGDRALANWTLRLDGIDLARMGIMVDRPEVVKAYRQVPLGFDKALKVAARNIRRTAKRQLPKPWQFTNDPGIKISQIVRPLDRVA